MGERPLRGAQSVFNPLFGKYVQRYVARLFFYHVAIKITGDELEVYTPIGIPAVGLARVHRVVENPVDLRLLQEARAVDAEIMVEIPL